MQLYLTFEAFNILIFCVFFLCFFVTELRNQKLIFIQYKAKHTRQ